MTDEATTVLNFVGMSIPPYSARGLTQTLEPIDEASNLRRTINGELVDLTHEQFRKYRSVINGSDQQPPAIDGVWQGLSVVVDCICELAIAWPDSPPPLESPPSGLARAAVSGSLRYESGHLFYRPQLIMRVTSFNVSNDEYGAVVSWSLGLEEV